MCCQKASVRLQEFDQINVSVKFEFLAKPVTHYLDRIGRDVLDARNFFCVELQSQQRRQMKLILCQFGELIFQFGNKLVVDRFEIRVEIFEVLVDAQLSLGIFDELIQLIRRNRLFPILHCMHATNN